MNNRIFITGANRGLGLELAHQYLLRGDQVFAGCRSPQRAVGLTELAAQFPDQLQVVPLDVTNQKSIDEAGQMLADVVDGLELLINNAAIHSEDESITSFDADEALNMLQTNAVGPIAVARCLLPLLKNGREPKIVNISSEAGSISEMNDYRGYYYFGSKAALNMYTRALAWDRETAGMIVVAFHPGWVRTDMGGAGADISSQESAAGIIHNTDTLTAVDNGQFFTWTGENYPW